MRYVPYFLLFACCGWTLSCTTKPKAPPTKAEEAHAVAEVFETKVDVAVQHLDSNDVLHFIAEHALQADSAAIMDFYKRRDLQYAWFHGDSLSAAADNLFGLMSGADTLLGEGQDEYEKAQDIVRSIHNGDSVNVDAAQLRNAELALTAQFFRFADKRYGGFVQRDVRDLDWFIPRRKKNVDQLLDSLAAGRMDLSAYEPVHPQYQALKEQLKKYVSLDREGAWKPIVLEKKGLAFGDSDSVVMIIRDHLFRLGDLDTNDRHTEVDTTLEKAVRHFQQRFGLRATGTIDAAFAEELGRPLEQRIRQILVNMERLRWVNPEPPKDHILVNIPEYRLHVYENGSEAWDMNVVVGATATRTAIFTGDLSLIVFAPYWNVPQSIIRSEILPAVKKNVGYLAKKEMEVVQGNTVVAASSIDWTKYSKGVPFTIRQKPGKQNALGQVKFLFPNEYSIYLHDTPSKSKFDANDRAFSHGCIRLSDPPKLANYLLRNDSTWTPKKIKEAMSGSKEVTVRLNTVMPVVIGYFTAWVDATGTLNFRNDVYGNDARLASELFATEGEVAAMK